MQKYNSFNGSPPSIIIHSKIRRYLVLLVFIISSCSGVNGKSEQFNPSTPTHSETQTLATPELISLALVRFHVHIPEDPAAEDGLQLSILDEVTGLALNVTPYLMNKQDETNFWIDLPFRPGSVIKYRYTRLGEVPLEEHITDGRQVRYRIYYVENPGEVNDIVTRWTDSTYAGPVGRIQGIVSDQVTGQPLPSILISYGGSQTLTTSDGSFLLEGLLPGIQNLTAYSLDGAYHVFQQGAQIGADSTTPVTIQLQRNSRVNITFNMTAPADMPTDANVRIAGNLYQLGNTFANLEGGITSIASRMPVMSTSNNQTFSLTLSLPVGADLRYKYTLGDGFWNAERTQNGDFLTRQLIVPDHDLVLSEQVTSWSDSSGQIIVFDVIAPDNTPKDEVVSIQFNPYAWTEPIPMQNLEKNHWEYTFYSPIRPLHKLTYRYCRNDQCNAADAVNTSGYESSGIPIDLQNIQEHPKDVITSWKWLPTETNTISINVPVVSSKPASYMRGVELQATYHPSWQSKFPYTLQNLNQLSTNWLILSPTWTYTRQNPPILELVPGQDPVWLDLLNSITLTKRADLQVAVFPQPYFPFDQNEWWSNGKRDFEWWVVWFERYRKFLLHHADLAFRSGAQALIIGGDWIGPALPEGKMPDGSASGVPEDANDRWQQIIREIRNHFPGKLLWALPFNSGDIQVPDFIQGVDQIYLLWSSGLTDNVDTSYESWVSEAGRLLDAYLEPISSQTGMPIVLGIQYPSTEGGITGCIPDPQGACVAFHKLLPQQPDLPTTVLDLQEQADAYSAVLQAVEEREWLVGVISRGYYPPAILQDKSTSINGKPAAEVLKAAFEGWKFQNP